MAFNVEEFQDLIRLLQERPEWRADLRRLVLTDELLALPELVRELVQAQQRTEVRVGRLEEALITLTEAQQRTEVRLGRLEEALITLTEAQQRTEVRVGRLEEALITLTEAQQRTEVRLGRLEEALITLTEAQQHTEVRLGRLEEALITLTEAQQRTEVRLGRLEEALITLTEAQQRTEVRVAQLEEGLESLRAETERRFQELAASQVSLNQRMDDLRETVQTLAEQTATLTTDVGELKGSDLERRYRERPFAYFQRLIRQAHTLSGDELNAMLDRAVTAGQLTDEDVDEIVWADVIVRGRRQEDGQEVFLVVEASWGVGPYDVQRADKRAKLLAKAGVITLPVVAGMWMTPDGEVAARTTKVWRVTNGRAVPPEQA